MTTPLAGITVLDFGQIYQGPYATMLMAKAGANVIKIEPQRGEPLRRRVMASGGDTTLPMAMLNANKKGVTLDLKSERGKELLKQMVSRADVLLENFSPGMMDDLGVGYEVLKAVNPRLLIYARTGLAGFGISGPDQETTSRWISPSRPASGIMSITWRSHRAADESGSDTGRCVHGRHPSLCGVSSRPCCNAPSPRHGAIGPKWRFAGNRLSRRLPPGTTITIARTPASRRRAPATARLDYRAHPATRFEETTDGHVPSMLVTEETPGRTCCCAMEREDLMDDPRFRKSHPDRGGAHGGDGSGRDRVDVDPRQGRNRRG